MIEIDVPKRAINDVYIPWVDCNSRVQIYFGGSTSGKSVFLAQRAVMDVLGGERNYLVVRRVGRTLMKSVWAEIENVITSWGIRHLFTFQISGRIIRCVNGKEIIFAGLDDREKLKSIRAYLGAITDVWIEEATEIDRDDITALRKRQRGGDPNITKRVHLSFNPIQLQHWIYSEYFSSIGWGNDQTEYLSDELSILKTWYIHNRFNTPQDIDDLENEIDPYWHDVYTLGNWGVLGNVIFKNWEIRDLSDMKEQFTVHKFGGDFGFAADPAAAIFTHYDRKRKTVFVYNEIYETDLTNDELADLVRPIAGDELMIWDSAEPKSIAELQKYKVNAVGAVKGKDSINHGIQWLRQQKIVIDSSCINFINEIQGYKWKEGRDGKPLSPPRPIGKNDHLIDALRYAYEDEMRDEWLI